MTMKRKFLALWLAGGVAARSGRGAGVAVAAGAVGYAAALTRALHVQAELDSRL